MIGISKIYTILKDSSRVNIFDLNHKLASKSKGAIYYDNYDQKNVLCWLVLMVYETLKNISKDVLYIAERRTDNKEVKHLLFANSQNQYEAVQPLSENLIDSLVYTNRWGRKRAKRLMTGAAYLISIAFFPFLYREYTKVKGYKKESIKSAYIKYWLSYGSYIVVRYVLSDVSPKSVTVSNDHSLWCRLFLRISQEESIKTFFVQHASATKGRPKMEFSIPLLEGRYSLEKYCFDEKKVEKIYLIGIPRFDKHQNNINRKRSVSSVGICSNRLASNSELTEIANHVMDVDCVSKVYYRPHPAEERPVLKKKFKRKNIEVSEPNSESAFSFISNTEAIISGNSNILLESGVMNVLPIYFDFDNGMYDVYDFVRNGVAFYTKSGIEVASTIEESNRKNINVRKKCKFYSETIGTKYSGSSSSLSSRIIQAESNRETEVIGDFKSVEALGPEEIPVYVPESK